MCVCVFNSLFTKYAFNVATHTVSHYSRYISRLAAHWPFYFLNSYILNALFVPEPRTTFPFCMGISSMNGTTQFDSLRYSLWHVNDYRKFHMQKDDTNSLVGNYKKKRERKKNSVKQNRMINPVWFVAVHTAQRTKMDFQCSIFFSSSERTSSK